MDYYVDCNATLPEEREEYFMTLLLNCWAVTAAEDYVSPERLVQKFNLLKTLFFFFLKYLNDINIVLSFFFIHIFLSYYH